MHIGPTSNNMWLVLHIYITYFSPCSVSFVLSGEYIQYSPLINFRLIIPSNIHLQLIIPSNIHLQCLCSTKNEKKTTSRRQFGIENYFYSESLTQPRNVKNKYVILRHLGDMCLFTSALRASVNKSHIPSLPQNNLYILSLFIYLGKKPYRTPVLSGYITTLKNKQKLDVSSEGPSSTKRRVSACFLR